MSGFSVVRYRGAGSTDLSAASRKTIKRTTNDQKSDQTESSEFEGRKISMRLFLPLLSLSLSRALVARRRTLFSTDKLVSPLSFPLHASVYLSSYRASRAFSHPAISPSSDRPNAHLRRSLLRNSESRSLTVRWTARVGDRLQIHSTSHERSSDRSIDRSLATHRDMKRNRREMRITHTTLLATRVNENGRRRKESCGRRLTNRFERTI